MPRELTEKEIKEAITEGFEKFEKEFDGIKDDVGRILILLEGDAKMGTRGLAERVKCSLEHYESWEREGKWKIINEMIEKYKIGKAIVVLIITSGAISLASLVETISNFLSR